VGFAWPPRHRDAGALLPHHFTLTGLELCSGSRLRRCHFCGTFPRVSPGRRYQPPCPVMSGLSSKGHLRDCSACESEHSAGSWVRARVLMRQRGHRRRARVRLRWSGGPAADGDGAARSVEAAAAASTVAAYRSGVSSALRCHRMATYRTLHDPIGGESLPGVDELLVERRLTTRRVEQLRPYSKRRHRASPALKLV
jgi:hypothetical protein